MQRLKHRDFLFVCFSFLLGKTMEDALDKEVLCYHHCSLTASGSGRISEGGQPLQRRSSRQTSWDVQWRYEEEA